METHIKDLKINYTVTGQGSPVCLLHGWGASLDMYPGVIARLSQSHTVYAMDFPGMGKSDEPPEAWCVDDYTDVVTEFLKQMELTETALIGHSFGGRVIAKLIARQKAGAEGASPVRFTKIILMDSAGIKPKKKLKARYKTATYKMAKFIFKCPIMKFLYPDYMDHIRKRRGSADYNAASPVMRGTLVRVVNEDLQKELSTITQPTLLIWGENDTTTPISDAHRMKELIADSDIVTVPGGHFSYIDSPGLVLGAMDAFLNE